MTEHCNTCRWWRTDQDLGPYAELPWRPQQHEHWGICERTASTGDGTLGYYSEPGDTDTLAYAADAERYSAILVTAPTFGCIQFEAKEQTPVIKTVMIFDNRMVATFDEYGQQMPEYQGTLDDVQPAILRDMTDDTKVECHNIAWLQPFLRKER